MWFDRALEMRRPDRGIGGFQAYTSTDPSEERWEDDPGFLMGAAGVALALLAPALTFAQTWAPLTTGTTEVLADVHFISDNVGFAIADGGLLLSSHVDVVPSGNVAAWKHPPFSGALEGGMIWGRGALDMKYKTALDLALMSWAAKQRLAKRLELIVVSDEETGSAAGSSFICSAERDRIRARHVINEVGGFNVEIAGRPIRAAMAISKRFSISIPIGTSRVRLPDDLQRYSALGENINRWYQETYGNKLKEDVSPGRSVISIDSDLYALRIPRLFGSVEFIVSREFLPTGLTSKGPALCNVVQLVEDLTHAKAAMLSDQALLNIGLDFERAFHPIYALESNPPAGVELVFKARGDSRVAVDCLLNGKGDYGGSKWASLQVAEKMLKAAILIEGGSYQNTHDLKSLLETLGRAGIVLNAEHLADTIQCKAGIRYGEIPCSQQEALAAHHASLDLINELIRSGIAF